MSKFKKVFYLKTLLISISICLLISAASSSASAKNCLRVPVGTKLTLERIEKEMQSRVWGVKEKGNYSEVFSSLSNNKEQTVEEISRNLDLPEKTVQLSLNFLVDTGIIIDTGIVIGQKPLYKINPVLKELGLLNIIKDTFEEASEKEDAKIREEIKNLLPADKLIAMLDFDSYNRESIIYAILLLGNFQEKKTAKSLIDLLDNPRANSSPFVVINIARALGKIGDASAKYPLGRLLQNSRIECRQAAKEALIQIDLPFYYELQKERVLCMLFAEELGTLIQYLENEDYNNKIFEKMHQKLESNYTFPIIWDIVEGTGGIESWKKILKDALDKQITLSEIAQKDLPPKQIYNITYNIPDLHYRNYKLFHEDLDLRLKSLFETLSQTNIKFLKQTLPSRPGDIEKHIWDDLEEYTSTPYEESRYINNALSYILTDLVNNSLDAVFNSMKNGGKKGIINLKIEIDGGNLLIYVSDNGGGIESQKLYLLSSGKEFESDKTKLSEKETNEIEKRGDARAEKILISEEFQDLEMSNLNFELGGFQAGKEGIGVYQSAALLTAYGGTLKIDTYNDKNEQTLSLTFGKSGLSDNKEKNLGLPIPFGIVKEEGKIRLDTGTTTIISLPLEQSSYINKLLEAGKDNRSDL